MKEEVKLTTTEVPAYTCPTCGDLNDAASNEHGATPSEGDVSMCVNCGEITMFNADLSQRIPTEEEMAAIRSDPTWTKIELMQVIVKRRGRIHEN
jgi:hypothetical protein